MRKEILLAILFGTTIGGIITYGIYRANQALINKATGNNPQLLALPSPAPLIDTEIELTIIKPENNIITNKDSITLQGKSIENAIILISSEQEDFILETDINGVFTKEIELIKGSNTIKITASDGTKLSPETSIDIVYSTDIDLDK